MSLKSNMFNCVLDLSKKLYTYFEKYLLSMDFEEKN